MRLIRVIFLVLVSGLLSACSSVQHTKTGFLDNYELLKPHEQYPDTRIYRAPEFDKARLQTIEHIYLPKFEVWLNVNQNAEFLSVNQSHIAKLSYYMQSQLATRLAPYYDVLTSPAVNLPANTLIVRGAFTNISFQEISLEARDFVPIKLVYNAGKTAYLAATEQTEAVTFVSLEAAFYIDNQVEPVFMMTASKAIESVLRTDGTENTKVLKAILDTWIDNFVIGMTKNKLVKN